MDNALEKVLQSIALDDMPVDDISSPYPNPATPTAQTPIQKMSWPSASAASTTIPKKSSSTVLGLPPGIVTPNVRSTPTSTFTSTSTPLSRSNTHPLSYQYQRQEHQERQHQRIKSRQGGILEKTANHLAKKRQWQKKSTQPEGSFKPDISEYSRQLKRQEPVHQRLFRVGQQNLEKKRERIIHDSKYDWETGEKLFHPKTNAAPSTAATLQNTSTARDTSKIGDGEGSGSGSGKAIGRGGVVLSSSIVAGNRLYRNALHSRAKLREKQIAELVLQEQQRQKVRMSPQSRHFAQKKVERELQTVFQRLNVSGTGLLTFEELSEGMASVHINLQSSVSESSGGSSVSSLSMPDLLFWSELTEDENGTNIKTKTSVNLLTFLSATYTHLGNADPGWTPLQVCNRSLTAAEVVVTWCRAWMEALAIGGRTPYGHVIPSDGRHRWKQSSTSVLGTEYNDFSGSSYRERKQKLAYESPDDRECTFKPKLSQRSRELDRKRIGGVRSGVGSSSSSHEARVALMLMLHQRKEDKLKLERERQALKDMEECTFSPAISQSTRTLRMVRKSMDDSDRSRFSADTNRDVPAFSRLHDRHEVHRKKKYMELTTEQRELLDYCTFQPNLQLRQEEFQSQHESQHQKSMERRDEGDMKTDEEKNQQVLEDDNLEENDDDMLLADFDLPDTGRMPWETAATSETHSGGSSGSTATEAKSTSNARGITVRELKTQQARPFFAAGVHDHTARIRSARKKQKEKERELQMMGKSMDFTNSLRMEKPSLETNKSGTKLKNKVLRGTAAKMLAANVAPLLTPSKSRNVIDDSDENQSSSTLGKVSIPPALRMRVRAADGGTQTIEIYAGDSPAVVARRFGTQYSLDSDKCLKLQNLIAAHMAKNDIPMNV